MARESVTLEPNDPLLCLAPMNGVIAELLFQRGSTHRAADLSAIRLSRPFEEKPFISFSDTPKAATCALTHGDPKLYDPKWKTLGASRKQHRVEPETDLRALGL